MAGISEKYLEQIINPLTKSGLVKSYRGAQGGYALNQPKFCPSVLPVAAGDGFAGIFFRVFFCHICKCDIIYHLVYGLFHAFPYGANKKQQKPEKQTPAVFICWFWKTLTSVLPLRQLLPVLL